MTFITEILQSTITGLPQYDFLLIDKNGTITFLLTCTVQYLWVQFDHREQ